MAHTRTPAVVIKGDMVCTMGQAEATKDIVMGGRAPASTPTKEEATAAPGGPKHLPKEAAETGPSRTAMKKSRR